jgi:hypothetical protein
MNMSTKDAIYYCGLIVGMIAGTLVARQWIANGLIQLGCGLAVGVGCGYVAEQLYSNLRPGGPDQGAGGEGGGPF